MVLCVLICSLINTIYTVQLSIIIRTSTLVPFSPILLYGLISVLLLDLHHVDLIQGNFVDTTTHTHPTTLNQIENIPTGTVLPPIPTSLVEKIESGAFIVMGDLILTCVGLDDTACLKVRYSVTNISE